MRIMGQRRNSLFFGDRHKYMYLSFLLMPPKYITTISMTKVINLGLEVFKGMDVTGD